MLAWVATNNGNRFGLRTAATPTYFDPNIMLQIDIELQLVSTRHERLYLSKTDCDHCRTAQSEY